MSATENGARAQGAAHASGVLFRSRIEITRILQRLAQDCAVISAQLGESAPLFLSRLLRVDPEGEFIVIAYGDERRANAALLQQESLLFRASDRRGRIEFTATAPVETLHEGTPAVRLAAPQALLRSQLREHPRIRIPADVSLRCIADSGGVAPFEARIIDISRGGMGGMLYDPGVHLAPGTVLRACKIMTAGSPPIVADLEVRYTVSVVQPDGRLAHRSGVKFFGRPEGLDALLKRFVIEFGADAEPR